MCSSLDVAVYMSCCTCTHWCAQCGSDTLFSLSTHANNSQKHPGLFKWLVTSPQCPVSYEEELLQQYSCCVQAAV